jgi:uncharacterized protein (TIGR02757 family)
MNLKQKLEYHYKHFDKKTIAPDPLEFLHRFNNPEDIETAGFISSVFAYGNVKQIVRTLEKIFTAAGSQPYEFISNYSSKREIKDLKHRFYTSEDICQFFGVYKNILSDWGSLKNYFLSGYDSFRNKHKKEL